MAQSASLFPEAANAPLVVRHSATFWHTQQPSNATSTPLPQGKTTTIADILIAADLLFATRHLDVTLPARIEAYAAAMKPTVMQGVAIAQQTMKVQPRTAAAPYKAFCNTTIALLALRSGPSHPAPWRGSSVSCLATPSPRHTPRPSMYHADHAHHKPALCIGSPSRSIPPPVQCVCSG